MLVKMLKQTRQETEVLLPGTLVNVSAGTAVRWSKAGIAESTGVAAGVAPEKDTKKVKTSDDVPVERRTVAVLKAELVAAGVRIPHKVLRPQLMDMVNSLHARMTEGSD